MILIGGGAFQMGSATFYREERPLREAMVGDFWIDRAPVTNREFSQFVAATGYVSLAERQPLPEHYPDADPALLVPGAAVFRKPPGPVGLRDPRAWWAYVPNASWRDPLGDGAGIAALADHPVVQVAHEDALAYANWCGKTLPGEAEWEFAARGGLDGAIYPWGDDPQPEGRHMANTWQGRFPWENLAEDGYDRTSPVGSFPANGYGLVDVVGNVWEWTATPFDDEVTERSCCQAPDAARPDRRFVVKGGSHLCAPNYCLRYRPAARQGEARDTATSHIGFRCIARC
ncbi:formylglycine-generating enzyme family protein [Sphingomonas mali]|uniref:formylglycine-generating enzyme family protein n=1 Tax=Sphingomonas mali TaxID=40682 RepID=UPI000A057BEE|nr:formylglycine-generating enzyme family protein [Sphingomonas mali]